MPPVVLSLPHLQQRERGDCLAACAAMVLAHIGIKVPYRRLLTLLQIKRGFGTPFYSIQRLKRLGVNIVYQQGTLNQLHARLTNHNPCIVPVKTAELPYWTADTDHAVVVVGMNETHV